MYPAENKFEFDRSCIQLCLSFGKNGSRKVFFTTFSMWDNYNNQIQTRRKVRSIDMEMGSKTVINILLDGFLNKS